MNPHKVDAIGLLSVLLVLAASYFGLFRGTSTELTGLQKQSQETKLKANERHGLLADLERAHQALQPLRETTREATAALASPGDVEQFLHELATTARTSGVKLNMLRPGVQARNQDSEYLPIHLVALAPFPRLHQFFSELEQSSQLTTVETLSITSKLDEADCEADVTLHLHLPRSDS